MAKLSENVKDMRRHVGKIFGKKQAQKIGTYQEAPGGGTAVDGGGRGAMKKNFKVVNSKEEADAIREENPKAVIRYNQPRDEDGRFTYNSANGKPILEDKSRGVTVPPFLRGAKMVFATKKKGIVSDGTTWNFNINMTAGELTSKFQDILGAKNAADSVERKKGRKSNVEKQAIKKKNEGFVKPDTNIHNALDYTIDYYIDDFRYRIGESMTGYKNKYKNKKNNISQKVSNMQQPAQDKQPAQPTKTVQPTQPTQSAQPAKKNNSDLAKNNPDKYVEENFDALNDIVSLAESKGYDVDVDAIVGGIANGDISSLEDFKKELENS
jgi:hypothetical protein